MASEFKQGDSVYFVFIDGKSCLDGERHPRMYKTLTQLNAKCPELKYGADVVEYVPKERSLTPFENGFNSMFVDALNETIRSAIEHGGDPGGAYFCEPDMLLDSINKLMALTGLKYDIVWTSYVGEPSKDRDYPKIILKEGYQE